MSVNGRSYLSNPLSFQKTKHFLFVPLPFECKSNLVALEDKQKTAFAKYNQIACNLFDYAFQSQPAAYQNDNLYFTSYFS